MSIGIIGTGNIGGTLARKLRDAGHEIRVANSRRVEGVRPFADEVGAEPVDVRGAVEMSTRSSCRSRFLPSLTCPTTSSRPCLKACRSSTLATIIPGCVIPKFRRLTRGWSKASGSPARSIGQSSRLQQHPRLFAGATGPARRSKRSPRHRRRRRRSAGKIPGLQPRQRGRLRSCRCGGAGESWRFQASTPAYCCDFNAEETRQALAAAIPGEAAAKRDRIMDTYAALGPNPTHADIVASNRVTNAPSTTA